MNDTYKYGMRDPETVKNIVSQRISDRALEIINEFTSHPIGEKTMPISINDDYWFKKLCALAERCAISEG